MTTVISLGDDDDFDTCEAEYVPLPIFTGARMMSQFSIKTYGRPKATCTPTSVDVAGNGDFIICDKTDKTLKIFNKMAQLKCDFGTTELEDPWNAALLPNNQIAITDSGDYPLCIYTQRGEIVERLTSTDLGSRGALPMIVDHKGDILMADTATNTIIVYDVMKNTITERLHIDQTFPLKNCRYICMNKHDNEVIVSDEGDNSVKAYSRQNGYLHWRHHEADMVPRDVCCDRHGHVLYVDGANNGITLLNERGKMQRQILATGARIGDSLVQTPQAVTIDNDGQLVVSDVKSAEIKLFNYLQ